MAAVSFAKEMREVMNITGGGVDDGMYKFATKQPSASSTITATNWTDVLSAFHKAGVDDQFVPPIVRVDAKGKPVGLVKDGDIVFYTDFRTDRAKPLTAAFLDIPYGGQVGGLSAPATKACPKLHKFLTMSHYDDNFNASSKLSEAFNPSEPISDTYAEVIGRVGVTQLICAETEKWRAVTWFKDGRKNMGYELHSEDGIFRTDRHPTLPIEVKVVQSRKVAAHIQAPQMRCKEICDAMLQGVDEGVHDIFANFANADMVGHAMTDLGWMDGVVTAIKTLDEQLGRLVPYALSKGYTVIITADHGNAEEMIKKKTGKAAPSHTKNKVPFIVLGLGKDEKCTIDNDPTIGAMAPTAMQLRGMALPASWNKKSALTGTVNASKNRKIIRLILDGYGVRDDKFGNVMDKAATALGRPLHMDRWMAGEDGALSVRAEASGERCGYPAGESGTTEFGHVLFDAGRDVLSDLLLINADIATGKFAENTAMLDAVQYLKKNPTKKIHVVGILSSGGVHSSLLHMDNIFKLFKKEGLNGEQLSLHPITDGRDVAGDSSPQFVQWLEEKIAETGLGQINAFWGRGWGKDRDNRWKRIEAAFRSMTEGTAGLHVHMQTGSKL